MIHLKRLGLGLIITFLAYRFLDWVVESPMEFVEAISLIAISYFVGLILLPELPVVQETKTEAQNEPKPTPNNV
jgi:hypothetical protein